MTLQHQALISLIEARCILTKPEKWGRGNYATTEDQITAIDPDDPKACRYCIQGAIWHSVLSRSDSKSAKLSPAFIEEHQVSEVVNKATQYLLPHLPPAAGFFYSEASKLIHYNDRTNPSHADILKVLDAGIADALIDFDTANP